MRRLFSLIAASLVLGGLIWAFMPKPVTVELADVGPRSLEVSVEEEGEARIREVFSVSASIAGKLQRISLHPGDIVIADKTVVALIGPVAPALLDARARAVGEATVSAAEAAVDLARAQVDQAEATLEFMTSEANRARALYEKSATTKRLLDSAILEQKTAQAAAESARANLDVRARELESARALLGTGNGTDPRDCCIELTSPVSGQVLRVLTENEQVVQPGTPILEVGNPGNLEIVVDLLSRDAVRVQKGASAEISGWGGPSIAARVDRVAPSAWTKVSALGIEEQRVEVILSLQGDPIEWRALGHGFRIVARIALWRKDGVLSVPVGALFRDGSDWAAFVLRDGRAKLQTITMGERSDDFAQVLDGLQPRDRVILHPSDLVKDGVAVDP